MANQVHVPDHHPRHDELTKQLTDHLAQHVAHANTTADYGGHGAFSNQGGFQQGGAAGADYETTSTGNTGECRLWRPERPLKSSKEKRRWRKSN